MRYPPLVTLPSSVDSPQWPEIWKEIVNSDEETGASMFRYWCYNSFWFFLRYCTTFGDFICVDRHNEHFGKPWPDHPWIFERCKELQDDPNDKWFQWPRYYFKTSLITTYYPLWEWIRDVGVEPQLENPGTDITVLVLTWKADKTGESFMFHMRREISDNEKLAFHWPDLFYPNPRDSGEFTSTSIRIRQRTNPREPSYAVAGIDHMPTSSHYRRIICDDVCVWETIRSIQTIKNTYNAMRLTPLIGTDDTERRWVGTHWAPGDCYAMARSDGLFAVDHKDCIDDQGVAILRSQHWLDNVIRKTLTDYDWAAQMRGDPIAHSEQRFKEDWLEYFEDAHQERRGKNVHIFIDPSRTTKDYSDYTAIAVIALGADRNYYVLDLYRDRLGLEEFTKLLFDLVVLWEPACVWEEQVGMARDIEHIKWRQREMGFRFVIKELPNERTPKAEVIGRLQRAMSSRRYLFPLGGFRHGAKGDGRDVMRIFIDEELSKWTPDVGSIHDDLLDVLAQPLRNKMVSKMKFPDLEGYRAELEKHKKSGYRRRAVGFSPQSAWVM